MQKADELPVPYASFVTSYGTYGKCDECEHAVDSTAEIRGKRYCSVCKEKKFPKSTAKFQDTDAAFKCPAKNCEADKLSYHQFYVGSCCDVALNREISDEEEEECLLIQKIYQQSKRDEESSVRNSWDARDSFDDARRKVRNIKHELCVAEQQAGFAKKKCDAAERKEKTSREWHNKVKKRLFVAAKAVQDSSSSSSDSSDSDDDVIFVTKKKAKQDEVIEKLQCKVCFNPFDDNRPEAIIIPCAHKFCFNCISALPEKKCPNCRTDFTDNNVYKTH
ncbi:Oidioi.mRNA.OKI2018_I69.chr1.g3741.t1.cds [Oikopleura dioica]|uniref:Oidioi.mRNA.OKI2018_I69.chr1.g3741.t1.cds n=1 Tax=Oikopleura dioica TaxID=34765 RepID=A0ABN7SWU7_OIKDI|nr:Oidioi.mRNA.OKI2018_I69.chr1.g3741.t1.cds [Oikopleura dioica]